VTAARRLRSAPADCALALSFLTIVPVPFGAMRRADLDGAAAWFPLVGALVGAAAGGARIGLEPVFGTTVASVAALVVLVALTGALHQDGLADSADGLGVRGDRERRLEVMRDSAIGVFGMLALLGWGLLLVAALANLSNRHAFEALIAAAALARWTALVHAIATPPARRDGLGAGFTVTTPSLVAATILALAAALLSAGIGRGLIAAGAAALVALASIAWARHAIGGRTGDTLGATVAIAEAATVLALLAAWNA